MKKLFLVTLYLIVSLSIFAQDKIYKTDKSVIECKVIDIGLNEVKYQDPKMMDGPTISIGVDMILKIVLSTGRVIEFKNPLNDPNSYINDKKKAIKLHFLSPLMEHLAFSFEKSIRPGRSFESGIGLIGVGFDTDELSKSSGVSVSAGYKFMRTPDFYSQRFKYAHIMKGAYVKPEVMLSVYRNEFENYFFNTPNPQLSISEQNIVAGALIINLGKQVVYDNSFLIDYSFGLGYGFSNQTRSDFLESNGWRANHYGFILGDQSTPIAVSFKIKIGFLL